MKLKKVKAIILSGALAFLGLAAGVDSYNSKAAFEAKHYDIREQGGTWDGKHYTLNGEVVKDAFFCDGTYTYFLQADGTPMTDRLTYHPDGEHVIYFDADGHEVFSNFSHVKKSISGDSVDDLCFFDVYGYMYTNVLTFNQAGDKIYYANPYGVMECKGWFQFADNAGGIAEALGVKEGMWGYAYANGVIEQSSIGDESVKNSYVISDELTAQAEAELKEKEKNESVSTDTSEDDKTDSDSGEEKTSEEKAYKEKETGKLLKRKNKYNKKGEINDYFVYEYEPVYNNCISETHYSIDKNKNEYISFKYIHEYDSYGWLIKTTHESYKTDGTLSSSTGYLYENDAKGNMIKETLLLSDGTKGAETYYEYDENGYLIKESFNNGWRKYTNDENGNPIRIDFNDGGYWIMAYDDHQTCTMQTSYNKDGTLYINNNTSVNIKTYVYDDNGNYIEEYLESKDVEGYLGKDDPSHLVNTYEYDADGYLIKKYEVSRKGVKTLYETYEY